MDLRPQTVAAAAMEGKPRILVVDDMPINVHVLVAALSDSYVVSVATGGMEALELLADPAQRPDLILLDVMMPGMDGYEVCRRLKADPALKDIPVIFVTARDDAESETEGLQAGAADYLTKPVNIPVARLRVRNQIEYVRAQAEVAALARELEERVARRTAQLESANREIEEFSYSISHDMRTPLRAIDGFSKILIEEYGGRLDDEGRRLLSVLRESSQHLGRLVDGILRFLSLGRRKLSLGAIDMAALVREVFAEYRTEHVERHLRLELGELPPAVGDVDMIRNLLRDLFSNALKFTPPEQEVLIEVGGSASPGESAYYVRDRGVGFDMRYVNKLFKVFERVHPTGQYEGTGIGLAIVKRIAERHGGRVWAEGQVGGGATIHFSLPAGTST